MVDDILDFPDTLREYALDMRSWLNKGYVKVWRSLQFDH
jgi:hypothetical protein